MQLKGLVRFFTILLILYSIYELSFTWVVRSHEKKMEAKAQQFVAQNYASADKNVKDQILSYSHLSSVSRLPATIDNYSILEFVLTPVKRQTLLTLNISNFFQH